MAIKKKRTYDEMIKSSTPNGDPKENIQQGNIKRKHLNEDAVATEPENTSDKENTINKWLEFTS